jgi:hypothetical protein
MAAFGPPFLQGVCMSDSKRFAEIFDGLKAAFGTYEIKEKKANGKNTGKYSCI